MGKALVWFRNDLRISDNESLKTACELHDKVIGIYCFDPRHYEKTSYGFKKTGKFRAKFLIESLKELKKNLKELNISIITPQEKPEKAISGLVSKYDISDIYFQKEWTSEEQKVENSLKKEVENVKFHSFFQQFLYHPEDIPFDSFKEIPRVFTEFRKRIEKHSAVRDLIPPPKAKNGTNLLQRETAIPRLEDLSFKDFKPDPRTAFPFKGGEDQSKHRLEDYVWKTENILTYKVTRNGLIGNDYSSKLSAWLANGCISPRYIYHEIKRFEKEVKSNQGTYWLIFELMWRDFFKYISLKHGNDIFKIGGILNKKLSWKQEEEAFQNWIQGKTEEAFVNANMKEIANTGFMSNRGRQNVNSFWAKELKQDWCIGAAYFESLLIDYDVHSNWGNWMYNSGVGNDPRDRKFNIQSQAERYDPNNEYQDLWLKN
ncbi:DASH family cryptochrome [Gramella jeungdoensis]|uniref:Cryptochrome DASH n=1 Tax=Gramella jeungdoensis TaxID=708091 RepID=A0ABT0YWT8_9FLAO|nr:DASH family cryptochrome [Gramella jeungdoensis]MCM8567920.1 DASH family cryptochrome [Gramella jeungdoensis]